MNLDTHGQVSPHPGLIQMHIDLSIASDWVINKLTSLVLVKRKRARVLLASPSMFIVPRKLVLIVLMGLYLQSDIFNSCSMYLARRNLADACSSWEDEF